MVKQISIIVPMYNAQRTIARCIQSAEAQSLRPFEIILVDDGSSDGTVDTVNQLADRYDNIVILRQNHKGVSAARNYGIEQAKGEWISFLDADDELLPKALERLFNENVDASLGGILRGTQREGKNAAGQILSDPTEIINRALTDPTNMLTCHGWIFRREICIEKDIQFSEELKRGEDSDWVIRFIQNCRSIQILSEAVYRYYISPESTINRWKNNQTVEYLKMLSAVAKTADTEQAWPNYVLVHLLLILTHDTFHPGNPASLKSKLREALRLRDEPVFDQAFRETDLHDFGVVRRIPLLCCKHRRMFFTWLIVRIRQIQNSCRSQ